MYSSHCLSAAEEDISTVSTKEICIWFCIKFFLPRKVRFTLKKGTTNLSFDEPGIYASKHLISRLVEVSPKVGIVPKLTVKRSTASTSGRLCTWVWVKAGMVASY